jgi:hypothetical protein
LYSLAVTTLAMTENAIAAVAMVSVTSVDGRTVSS